MNRYLKYSILTTAIVLLYITVAWGHSWYPSWCCSDQDCLPVPCEDLLTQGDGSVIYDGITFAKEMVKESKDQFCHVCMTAARTPLCLFQQFGF